MVCNVRRLAFIQLHEPSPTPNHAHLRRRRLSSGNAGIYRVPSGYDPSFWKVSMTIKSEFQARVVREWIASLQVTIRSLTEMELDASGDTKLFLKVIKAGLGGLVEELTDNLNDYQETRKKEGGTRK